MGRRRASSSAPNRKCTPGERLRAVRLVLDLSFRDVYSESIKLARRLRNEDFVLPPSRLHEIESRDVIPSIHRLYTLAWTYGHDVTELLRWYGIPEQDTFPSPASAHHSSAL
jgi:hypothetical protein